MMSSFTSSDAQSDRLFPSSLPHAERTVALSILDATAVNLDSTTAFWFFDRPVQSPDNPPVDLADHLRKSLRVTLNAYPQWCGQLKGVNVLNDTSLPFEPHAKRFGRAYIQYGTPDDPGVEFVSKTSKITLTEIYPTSRPIAQPLWKNEGFSLDGFLPTSELAHALRPATANEAGLPPPALAIQLTQLACGGFVLAAAIAHPLADAFSLVQLIKDWGRVSQALLLEDDSPVLTPVFEPEKVDTLAAGDINSAYPDPEVIRQAETLPLDRYDWWAPSPGCPWPGRVPDVFNNQDLSPAGKPMPWDEWDVNSPVSHYVIHLSFEQVESIWRRATGDPESIHGATNINYPISRHDAVLAHIWSCIAHARGLQDDTDPVHCNLVYGLRPILQTGSSFLGSPTVLINVEMAGRDVAAGSKNGILQPIAQKVRQTIKQAGNPTALAAHLHSLAYEKSPQRIFLAFLGQRHIIVTTWARAGLYDVDFGLGETIVYADGVIPGNVDGCVIIKEAPPKQAPKIPKENPTKSSWTDSGVDISLYLREQDMERLLKNPYLFP